MSRTAHRVFQVTVFGIAGFLALGGGFFAKTWAGP